MFLMYSAILNFKNLKPFGLGFWLRPDKSGFPISPHLPASGIFELRQMPFRIGDYSETTSFLYLRQT
jgi:hypothetical protein